MVIDRFGFSGLLVEESSKLTGIITRRDITFIDSLDTKVSNSYEQGCYNCEEGITIQRAKEVLHQHRIENSR